MIRRISGPLAAGTANMRQLMFISPIGENIPGRALTK
jgi:hypothetical protein